MKCWLIPPISWQRRNKVAELNLKQITDKLNEAFSGDIRRLIFWYDDNGDFADDVDALELTNAKVYHLEPGNQFKTKLFLEREDTTTNYLIYAPFPKPDIRENHLADTIRYSREFFADRVSLLMLDLGADERCKPTLQKYIKFFGSKQRTQAFFDLDIGTFTPQSIEVGIMSVLCRAKFPSFEEVARVVLTDGELTDNAFLGEFAKYQLLDSFWKHCSIVFGYADEEPTLTKLLLTLFVTYAGKAVHDDLPAAWQPFVSFKSGNAVAFLDGMMNNVNLQERFDQLSEEAARNLNAEKVFSDLGAEPLTECGLFRGVDPIILSWMTDRLLNEDVGAKLNGRSILEICGERKKLHFGSLFRNDYALIENALSILQPGIYRHSSDLAALTRLYTENYYKIDRHYRLFYRSYDALEDHGSYENLHDLIERVYTNDFLNPLAVDFSSALSEAGGETPLEKQWEFYSKRIRYNHDRVAVIISDAMRYEVGVSLFEALEADEKCTASLSAMQSILPSVTRLGMTALLPHRALNVLNEDAAYADGLPTTDLAQREAVLKKEKPQSRTVRFDEIKDMNQADLREIFTGQEVVYIYHDQIDARGDKLKTENEVFVACEEAVEEIVKLIRRLSASANTTHFIVTSDHGFLYRRDKLTESGKISGIMDAGDRYVISEEPIIRDGVCSIPLKIFDSPKDTRVVSFPMGSDLFKAPGSGKNYVHGGCSPQEVIVPLIDVKTEKGKREIRPASIDLLSAYNKITNLVTTLTFTQTEPVSDVVKEAEYRLCFVTDDGEKISNEIVFTADRKDPDISNRIYRHRFSFRNRKYGRDHRYYLIARDASGMEVLRREFVIDLAFTDDYGF